MSSFLHRTPPTALVLGLYAILIALAIVASKYPV
jgi:hypothetical protein